jgi:hypothetical protein
MMGSIQVVAAHPLTEENADKTCAAGSLPSDCLRTTARNPRSK